MVSIAILAVINAAYEIIPMSGSKLGLALSYAFALVGYLNGIVDSVARSEQELISVERVGQYIALPDEFEQHKKNYKYRNRNSDSKRSSNSSSTANVGSVVTNIKNFFVKHKDTDSPEMWPHNGNIELCDVSFSYAIEHQEYERLVAWNAAKTGAKMDRTSINRNHRGGGGGVDIVPGTATATSVETDGTQQSFALSEISLCFESGSRTVVIGRTGR